MTTQPTDANPANPWPADQLERRAVAELQPNPRNARTHSEEQVAQIATLIEKHGWTMPVLVDEADVILAGHGRWMAARQLGYAEVPVIVARGWSEAQKRAYVLADNKVAQNAGWDLPMLKLEIADLQLLGADLGSIGFSNEELRDIVFPVDREAKSAEPSLGAGLSYQVVIECEGEDQQAELLEEFRTRGIKCKPLIL